jgi:hypothetical protein
VKDNMHDVIDSVDLFHHILLFFRRSKCSNHSALCSNACREMVECLATAARGVLKKGGNRPTASV